MLSGALCVMSFLVAVVAARRSLVSGLIAVVAVGYAYGIVRANVAQTMSHLIFDSAVVGLLAVQLWRSLTLPQQQGSRALRGWLIVLVAWPVALFFLAPGRDPLVELVGLRGNVFFLPFLVLGARLEARDVERLTVAFAYLNILAFGLAMAEFVVGVEPFFPRSQVTELIYRSNDVAGREYRIPSSFANAHAYAGTMVMTLPFLLGALAHPIRRRSGRHLLEVAAGATLLGVFMSAARSHAITAAIVVLASALFSQRGVWPRLRTVVVLGLVAWTVSADVRLQRFATLQDTTYVGDRVGGSVNVLFWDLMGDHPMGRGLASGGTSVPYFLQDRTRRGDVIENEYGRIMLEQGVPGLMLWLLFVMWFASRWPHASTDAYSGTKRSLWCACVTLLVSGLLGTGLMASVPQTMLMLTGMGWIAASRRSLGVPSAQGVADQHRTSGNVHVGLAHP